MGYDSFKVTSYYLSKDQASILAIDAMKSGIPKDLVGRVLDIANKSYLLAAADEMIRIADEDSNLQSHEYTLDLNALEKIARFDP